jgi:hypothetical protein
MKTKYSRLLNLFTITVIAIFISSSGSEATAQAVCSTVKAFPITIYNYTKSKPYKQTIAMRLSGNWDNGVGKGRIEIQINSIPRTRRSTPTTPLTGIYPVRLVASITGDLNYRVTEITKVKVEPKSITIPKWGEIELNRRLVLRKPGPQSFRGTGEICSPY